MKSKIAMVLVMLAGMVQAGQIEIIGFDSSRGLQFEGGTVSNFYTLEFAQHPDGPWTNWGSVSSQAITGTVMSLPSPFFFRVVEAQSNTFPPYATGTPVYVESDPVAMSAGFLTAETDPVATAALADFETKTSAAATYQPLGDYATGTPVYVESDPQYQAEKSMYATGTPVYAESDPVAMGAGFLTGETDPVATAALADYETKAGAAATYQPLGDYATGMPVYVETDPVYQAEKTMYATGTPLYVEVDPIWRSESNAVWTAIDGKQPAGTYATGTPVYAESDPIFSQHFLVDSETGNIGYRAVSPTSAFTIASTVRSTNLSGTVSIFADSDQLAGGSTQFQTQLVTNDVVVIDNVFTSRVKSIASQTALTLTTSNNAGNLFGVSMRRLNDQNILTTSTTLNSNYFGVDSLGNINASGYLNAKGGVLFGNGLMTNAAYGFGAYETNHQHNTVYQAPSDGFVLFTANPAYVAIPINGYVYVGLSTNSFTMRGATHTVYDGITTCTVPVRKGEYWKTTGTDGVRLWAPLQ